MRDVKSRREMYSESTRAALLEQATALFAARGYAGTSLEDVAAASQVTRGAVYHHFDSKLALFQAVAEEQETRAVTQIAAAAAACAPPAGPREAALAALDAYLDKCCDPVYGRLIWQECPAVLGWQHWMGREEKHAYGLVERFVRALMDAGFIECGREQSTVRFAFWMLGGAGLAVTEAPEADRPRIREEWGYLIRRVIESLRAP